ncbi:MAG TPA: fibrobacter succinogenes major paralogous domain-containing protein [Bacteroidia bacterium]|nr:fibrobacter succinogenes major paralogous domain-containing protein [Bacteroidia bacterium]
MKRIELIISFALLLGLCPSIVTAQDIVNKGYVQIGTQVWTTENLDVSTFGNGDTIPEIEDQKEFYKAGLLGKPAWCYYNGDSSNRSKYGKLYNWYAVHDSRGLAPKGWHIPSDSEWTILTNYLGGDKIAGRKMRAKEFNGDNSNGFNALPAGNSNKGASYLLRNDAFFWTTTEESSGVAWDRTESPENTESNRNAATEASGFSVRCIKD